MRSSWLLLVVLVSCGGEPARSVSIQHDGHEKPGAPVDVAITATSEGSGTYLVRLVATPRADLESAQLRLILPVGVSSEDGNGPVVFGPIAGGRQLTVMRRVKLAVASADLVGDVRVSDGVTPRNRARIIHLGPPEATKVSAPIRTVTLPDGVQVDEVRQ